MSAIQEGQQLRFAVIGIGAGVFGMHRAALHLPVVNLVAVSDISANIGQQRADELGCTFYTDHCQMLAEQQPEVVVIMTPHSLHAQLAIDCLEAGSNVLVEKPMAVHVAEADEMIAVAQRQQKHLGVIFQHRLRPEIRAIQQILQAKRIGRIQHVSMNAIWTRTATYYRSAGWRGTWSGEGGGVLMNQAPHHLDLLCHLLGEPVRVVGWTRRVLHQIETEDTVQAALEWANGALGSLHISTAEADQAEYLKIVGTHGRVELNDGRVTLHLLDSDLQDFVATHPKGMAAPTAHEEVLTLGVGKGSHAEVYEEFSAAVLQKRQFTSEATEGRMALELANALIYSSYSGTEVVLPLDRQKYLELLTRLRNDAIRNKKQE